MIARSLQRGAAVSGRVLYPDGSPASQVTIDVQNVDAKPSTTSSRERDPDSNIIERTFLLHQSSGTDDRGHFRITGLRPGTYRVAAIQPSTEASNGMAMFQFFDGFVSNSKDLRIYSGDTLHKKSAKTYELRSGDEVSGVDITESSSGSP